MKANPHWFPRSSPQTFTAWKSLGLPTIEWSAAVATRSARPSTRRKLPLVTAQHPGQGCHWIPLLVPLFLNPRFRSLARANVLVLGSFAAVLPLSHFPHLQANYWITLPLLVMAVGTLDTLRCMRTRWNFYHGGVILCAYMDLMVIILTLFLLLYPIWL